MIPKHAIQFGYMLLVDAAHLYSQAERMESGKMGGFRHGVVT